MGVGYATLLRDHISKEDDILYPLAERVIPETMRTSIMQGYQAAESFVPRDFVERYNSLVAHYEQE
jgi:hemerythrin-like domain-containing protein